MRPGFTCFSAVLVLGSLLAAPVWASPLSSSLLPLVPAGAPVVAGFENHCRPDTHGRLLLTTHNNRVDLDDWQALTGMDNKRVFNEIVEVAGSASGDDLAEHLLLVSGHFDRERIFQAAELGGAQATEYLGQAVMIVQPFARERGDMIDTRWLAILENRVGLLGTPYFVKQAMNRYVNHALPDPVLEERLTQMRSDVTSWNVIVAPSNSIRSINFAQPRSAWARLQEGADVLMVGARFGSKVRVDFSIHASSDLGREFFAQKATFFTNAFAPGMLPDRSPDQAPQRRLQSFTVESNRVHGSIELSGMQFERWVDQLGRVPAAVPQATILARGN